MILKRGFKLIVVVPVWVGGHVCSGQFLSVIHDGIPILQTLEEDVCSRQS